MKKTIEIVEDQEALRDAIRYVLLAADTASSRYTLQSVLIEYDTDGGIAVVATDGRRIHYVRCANAQSENLNRPILLPLKLAKWIANLSKAKRSQLTITVNEDGEISVKAWKGRNGREENNAQGMEEKGRYPTWRLLIENDHDKQEGTIAGNATDLTELFRPDYSLQIDLDGVDVCVGRIRRVKPHSLEVDGITSIAMNPDFMADALSLPGQAVVQFNGPETVVRVLTGNSVAAIMPFNGD